MLGTDDPFRDASHWDEATAREWAGILDVRATAADQVRLREALLQVAGVRPGDHVAEIGCGTGALLMDVARAVGPTGHVTGFDPQPQLVEAARARAISEGVSSRVSVDVGSADAIDLATASVGVCLAQTVAIHLDDELLARSLAEIRRVLRPGGRFVSADQDGDTWTIDHPDRELTRRIVDFHCDQRYADGWMGRRLRRHLLDAGFASVDVQVVVQVDLERDSYFHRMALRIANAAMLNGVITARQEAEWTRQLNGLAEGGRFFSSMNYYITRGIAS